MKRLWAFLAVVFVLLTALVFGIFVWPTPYEYISTKDGSLAIVYRINKLTGNSEWMEFGGSGTRWRRVKKAENDLPPTAAASRPKSQEAPIIEGQEIKTQDQKDQEQATLQFRGMILADKARPKSTFYGEITPIPNPSTTRTTDVAPTPRLPD